MQIRLTDEEKRFVRWLDEIAELVPVAILDVTPTEVARKLFAKGFSAAEAAAQLH